MHTCKTMETLKHWLLLAMCMHALYAVIWSCTGEALARLTTNHPVVGPVTVILGENSVHGRAPAFLCSKFSRNLNAEYRETRGANINIQLQCPRTNFYRKYFEFNGAYLWNKLPRALKSIKPEKRLSRLFGSISFKYCLFLLFCNPPCFVFALYFVFCRLCTCRTLR